MRKYIAEFIGTFFLVLTVGMCVIKPGVGNLAPFAIGSALMIMVYAGGHISGGHFNPIVTLAVWLRWRGPVGEVPWYWLAQVAGAAAASGLVLFFKENPLTTPMDLNPIAAIIAELLGAFAWAYVVLNIATSKATKGNSNYGLAAGFAVMTMNFALGGIAGGAFNPAVAVGLIIMHLAKAGDIWIYLLGNFAGGALAALAFRTLNPDDI
jgi:aquaporin Z